MATIRFKRCFYNTLAGEYLSNVQPQAARIAKTATCGSASGVPVVAALKLPGQPVGLHWAALWGWATKRGNLWLPLRYFL